MNGIELLAGAGIFLNDLFAVGAFACCIGSLAIVALNTVADNGFRIRNRLLAPGLLCLVFGSIFQTALLSTNPKSDAVGFVLRLPINWCSFLFFVSFLLIIFQLTLPRFLSGAWE